MHSGNYVVDITPDLDDVSYTLRAIDFDQQSHNGRCHVYLPQYYKQNTPIVFLRIRCMSVETFKQYREEERTLIANRAQDERIRLDRLLTIMAGDNIAPRENVVQLRRELGRHWKTRSFDQLLTNY